MFGKPHKKLPELFEALGEYQNRQDWPSNWRTTALLRLQRPGALLCRAGHATLVAVAADQAGSVDHPYSNYQLIIAGGQPYGIGGKSTRRSAANSIR